MGVDVEFGGAGAGPLKGGGVGVLDLLLALGFVLSDLAVVVEFMLFRLAFIWPLLAAWLWLIKSVWLLFLLVGLLPLYLKFLKLKSFD